MMLYELDGVEKDALLDAVVRRARADLNYGKPLTEIKQRPGEKVQRWYCVGCNEWHEASVLGGAIVREEHKDVAD